MLKINYTNLNLCCTFYLFQKQSCSAYHALYKDRKWYNMTMKYFINILLFFCFVIFYNSNLYAKDILIPDHINGTSKKTLFDYSSIADPKFDLKQELILGSKEIYNFYDQWRKYNLHDYLLELDETYLNIPLSEFASQTSQDDYIAQIIPLAKPLILPKKPLEFFDVASEELQYNIKCPITPILKKIEQNTPQNFNITNNLRRAVKTPFVAAGDIIYIQGQIKDVNCVPIPNAIVQIWQNDAYGMSWDSDKKDKYFLGNGTAVSDNMGNFSFITILPNIKKDIADIAPHVNLAINHKNFKHVNTKIFFAQNILNQKDKMLSELDKFNQELLTAELIPVEFSQLDQGYFMLFDVTLNGVSAYRY